jgi:hypothetical protein
MVSDRFGRPEKDLKSRPETLQGFGDFALDWRSTPALVVS